MVTHFRKVGYMKFSEMPYKRIDIEKFKENFGMLMTRTDNAKSGEEQFDIHKEYYNLIGNYFTQMILAQIRNSIDVTDEFYEKENDYYDENSPVVRTMIMEYGKKLFNSPYRQYLEEKIGKVAFKNIELGIKSVDDRITDLMKDENALVTRYNKLIAKAKISWKDEELNLSLLTPYLNNADREVRKEAWTKYSEFFRENKEELDDIYDQLVKNRTAQAEKLGYENYIPLGYYRMKRNCYDRNDVKKFREQIKRDFVPFAEKLHDRRRQRLGLDKLYFYDEGVYFKNGNPRPIGTPDEILIAGKKMYNELSKETADFINFMYENELFDVYGRKTKMAGGYMTELPDYKSPFIFANFNGTAGDADVMTHECGHAFQYYTMLDDPIIEHYDITMETAETHSMSMEFFTEPWMELFFGDRKKDYIDMHLESSAAFIPYGTIVDEFQDIIYSNPGLSPKQRNEVWRDLERQYKPHLDYTGSAHLESGAFWQKQGHIYNTPFYYIDYVIAQVNAFQYKVMMDKDYKKAWENYLTFCKLGAKDFFTNLLVRVGLNSPFEDGSMKELTENLKKYI